MERHPTIQRGVLCDGELEKSGQDAEDYPYEAVSIVSEKLVTIKFDLESKKSRVVDVTTDSRDIRGRNYMSGAAAVKRLQELVKIQKEITNEEN